jgi:undecaprenyl-diphosphatase
MVWLCAVVTAILVTDALIRDRSGFDYALINAVRRITFPGDEDLMTAVSRLTGTEGAVAAWFVVLGGFLVARRWLEALALAVMPLGSLVSQGLQNLVDRPRPDLSRIRGREGSIRAAEDQDFASFPSGHVVGAMLLYGLLFVLAKNVRSRRMRWTLQGFFLGIILLTGSSRGWRGTHWGGVVVTAYALGGALLGVLVIHYRRAAPYVERAPLIGARNIPHDESSPHAHALTSLILFRGDETWKVYSPGFVPQAIYWLSFQAPFPYAYNVAALQAAIHRRNLAGLLTEYWYGERRVAEALRIDEFHGKPAVVGEYVPGVEPGHESARPFLTDLAEKFDLAGLPTWQIDPGNRGHSATD